MMLLVGVALGLIGGGGGILAVPILAYFFHQSAAQATGHSLFVVGAAALVGALGAMRRGEVSGREVLLFALPSMAASFVARAVVLPAIPHDIGGLDRNRALMLLFAATMLLAAWRMIRGPRHPEDATGAAAWLPITLAGLGVGLLAGLVGAGGGFLIVPALLAFGGVSMRLAIGSSLAIIAIQSLGGFLGEVLSRASIDWPVLLGLTGVALAGLGIGAWMNRRTSPEGLRLVFGWFVLAMGLVILGKELLG